MLALSIPVLYEEEKLGESLRLFRQHDESAFRNLHRHLINIFNSTTEINGALEKMLAVDELYEVSDIAEWQDNHELADAVNFIVDALAHATVEFVTEEENEEE